MKRTITLSAAGIGLLALVFSGSAAQAAMCTLVTGQTVNCAKAPKGVPVSYNPGCQGKPAGTKVKFGKNRFRCNG